MSAIKLALGLLLLILAWRQLDKRPKPGGGAPAEMDAALDGFTPGRSLVFAALLSGLKPKNLILNASAAAGIAQSGLGGPQQAVVLLLLIVVGSLGIIAPVAVYFAMGDKAAPVLDGWKTWLVANNVDRDGRALRGLRRDADRQGHRGTVLRPPRPRTTRPRPALPAQAGRGRFGLGPGLVATGGTS